MTNLFKIKSFVHQPCLYKTFKIINILIAVLFLSSCYESFGNKVKNIADKILPEGYKGDLKQGLIFKDVNIKNIKEGMSKSEIKKILGSPTIVDPFHKNRWDYINRSRINGKIINKSLILFFNNNNTLDSAKTNIKEYL